MSEALNPEEKLEQSKARSVSPVPPDAIRAELRKIVSSHLFRAAHGQKKFLSYAVEQSLAGHAQLLKEYVIATEALGRDSSFDPRLDSIVRTEARKLRARLAKYYETEGANDALRIEFPKGSYVPGFQPVSEPSPEPLDIVEKDVLDEETGSGVTETEALPRPAGPSRLPWFHGRRASFAVGTVGVLAVLGAAALFGFLRRRPPNAILPADNISIAVLPLANLGNANEEFLSDALTDGLITDLGQIPGLHVLSRAAALRFQSKTLKGRATDQTLHVNALLVGTVSRSENRLQVSVGLNSAENGYRLWSGSYERESSDIGTLSNEIADEVSNVLGVSDVQPGVSSLMAQSGSPNSAAHEYYVKGLYFRDRYDPDSLNRAIELFKQAIVEDPSFAWAYAGLADCYAMSRPLAAAHPLDMVPKIEATASKALELDSKLGEPHIDLAVSAEYEFDWATAEKEFKKGLELSPDSMVGHLWYSQYLSLVGRKADVLAQRAIAARLDPVSPWAVQSVGGYYSAVGRYDAAAEQFRSALALEPSFGLAHEGLGLNYLLENTCASAIEELRLANKYMPGLRRLGHLGYAYAVCGRADDARRILSGLLKEPEHTIPAFVFAEIYLGLGDKDHAFLWFSKAVDERDLSLKLKWDPLFDPLRSDPRFAELLRRMKLG